MFSPRWSLLGVCCDPLSNSLEVLSRDGSEHVGLQARGWILNPVVSKRLSPFHLGLFNLSPETCWSLLPSSPPRSRSMQRPSVPGTLCSVCSHNGKVAGLAGGSSLQLLFQNSKTEAAEILFPQLFHPPTDLIWAESSKTSSPTLAAPTAIHSFMKDPKVCMSPSTVALGRDCLAASKVAGT